MIRNMLRLVFAVAAGGLFVGEVIAAAPETTSAVPTTVPLSSQRREILSQRLREFESLPESEQQRIRSLHEALQQSSEDAKKLQGTLSRYDRWLATLSPVERRRIEEAPTTEARLVVVRELVNEQAVALERELSPLRLPEESGPPRPPGPPPNGPGPSFSRRPDGSRPEGARPRSNFFEEQRQLTEKLKPHLTPFESLQLEEMRGRHRFPLILALLIKYDLPLPSFFQDNELPMSPLFLSLVGNPESIFGAKAPQLMSGDARKKFGAFMADVLLLPDLDEKKRFAFLQAQPEAVREAAEELSNLNQYVAKSVVNTFYFAEHPEEAPEETRDSLKMINVTAALQFLSNPIIREALRPTGPPSFWGTPGSKDRSPRGARSADGPPPPPGREPGGPPTRDRESR
jgi:hypothetical protein